MEQRVNFSNLNSAKIPEHITEALTTFAIAMYQEKLTTYTFKCEDFSGVINTDFVEKTFLLIRCISFEFNLNIKDVDALVDNYQGTFAIQKDVLNFDYKVGFEIITSPDNEITIPVTAENFELINQLIKEGRKKLN